MTFGTKIRMIRNILGYSQQNVAHMLDISENSYRNYENDTILPKAERKQEIAKAFGITVDQLESFGEGGIIFLDEIKCETGGFVNAKGVVTNHNIPLEFKAEIEKLKLENISKEQHNKDLKTINSHLEKRIADLEAIINLLKRK